MKIEVIKNGKKVEVKNDEKSKDFFGAIDKKFNAYFYEPKGEISKKPEQ